MTKAELGSMRFTRALFLLLRRLSVGLHPRSHDQPRQLERAAQYILAELQSAGGTVSVQQR